MSLTHYYPEMDEKKPVAQIEGQLSHYGRHWYIWTPLELKGRGIEFTQTETDPIHRRHGWHRYKVTTRAFDVLCTKYTVSTMALL